MTRSTHAVPILAALFAAGCLVASAQTAYPTDEKAAGPLVHRVQPADFVHDVTQRCNIDSASSVEIRCEVKSGSTSGTAILYIVPEGTYVRPTPDWKPKHPDEEPPDLLVKLDSSALEKELTQQEMVCANSQCALIQAKNSYDSAAIANKEYKEATYNLTEQDHETQIIRVQQAYQWAKEHAEFSKTLMENGYITQRQYNRALFDVQDKKLSLDMAKLKKDVFLKYESQKRLKELQADMDTAEARLDYAEYSYKAELERLERIKRQIENCTLRAPAPGLVVYASRAERRGGGSVIIKEGARVRQRQVILRLQDPKRMQAKAKIDQASAVLVKEGMPATIRVDAFPDLELEGTVKEVGKSPPPGTFERSRAKEYEAIIRIHKPPPGLRIGLTGEAKIHIERLSNVLQVPVQAVLEHKGKHYCLVRHGRALEAREVTLGPTNDKFAVIRGGLKEGEEVAPHAAARTAPLEELLRDTDK